MVTFQTSQTFQNALKDIAMFITKQWSHITQVLKSCIKFNLSISLEEILNVNN
jgi:hypothetical protein